MSLKSEIFIAAIDGKQTVMASICIAHNLLTTLKILHSKRGQRSGLLESWGRLAVLGVAWPEIPLTVSAAVVRSSAGRTHEICFLEMEYQSRQSGRSPSPSHSPRTRQYWPASFSGGSPDRASSDSPDDKALTRHGWLTEGSHLEVVGRSQILVRLPSLGQGRAVLGLTLVEERQGPASRGDYLVSWMGLKIPFKF